MTRPGTGTDGQRGAAAVETAMTLTLVLAFTGLVAPLPLALLEKGKLERAAAQTARWATSAPPSGRGLRPGADPSLVQAEAQRALEDSGSRLTGVTAVLTETAAAHCPLRLRRTVEVTGSVDLGPLSPLLSAFTGTDPGASTLSARATACNE